MPTAGLGGGSSARPTRSLVARGGVAHTFGTIAGSLALMFLFFGSYFLAQDFANPLAAGSVALVGESFIIALAITMLFYLFKPRRRARRSAG